MASYRIPLEADSYYHIYNHANGSDDLFKSPRNCSFFLSKFIKYISPIADTFAYCLMYNHFHVMIRIKPERDLVAFFRLGHPSGLKDAKGLASGKNINILLSRQFNNLFNSYAKAFNLQQNRMGSLFNHPFKRKQITTEEHIINMILYIHCNPVHHRFVKNINNWKYSSYPAIVSGQTTFVSVNEVIALFGDLENFKFVHQTHHEAQPTSR